MFGIVIFKPFAGCYVVATWRYPTAGSIRQKWPEARCDVI